MSDMDDIAKGFGILNQGMRDLATSRAVGKASQQIHELHATELNEMQKRSQMQQVANSLALRLTQIGSPASTIQTAFNAIAPPKIDSGKDAFIEGTMKQSDELLQAGQAIQKFEMKPKKMELDAAERRGQAHDSAMLDIASGRAETKEKKRTFDQIRGFQKTLDTTAKKNFDAIEQARTALAISDDNNPIGDAALATFMARATGEVGNLTENERKPFESSRDISSQLQQWLQKAKNGKLTPDNRRRIKQLAKVFESSNLRAVNNHADRISSQASSLLGMDQEEIRTKILPKQYTTGAGPNLGASAPSSQTAGSSSQPSATQAPIRDRATKYLK